jgi:hypothetical protein
MSKCTSDERLNILVSEFKVAKDLNEIMISQDNIRDIYKCLSELLRARKSLANHSA